MIGMNLPTLDEATKLSRKTGMVFVCASCPRIWEGIALGKESCTGVNCGSPVRRKDFPEYAGSLKDLSALCFVCGSEEVLAYAKVEGSDKKIGMCKTHLEIIDDYAVKPTNGIIVSDKKVMVIPNENKVMSQFKGARHTL